jgi:hypothetical protein
MRVVVTRIEQDGAMQRRMVDTASCSGGPPWESVIARALLPAPPPYHLVPGAPIYHISLGSTMMAMAAEHDLGGPLLDLVTAVLAMGSEL